MGNANNSMMNIQSPNFQGPQLQVLGSMDLTGLRGALWAHCADTYVAPVVKRIPGAFIPYLCSGLGTAAFSCLAFEVLDRIKLSPSRDVSRSRSGVAFVGVSALLAYTLCTFSSDAREASGPLEGVMFGAACAFFGNSL